MTNTIYGQRIAEARSKLGMSQRQLAQKVSRSQGFISNIESGRQDPSFDLLTKLWAACGINPNWIVTGEGDMQIASAAFPGRIETVAPPDYGKPMHGDLTVGEDEFSMVKRLDVSVAAGSGRINYDPQVIGHVLFSNQWLGQLGIAADLAGLVTVSGDSMLPTLADAALALVDFRATIFESGKVFVLRQGDEVMVKRIFLVQDGGREGILIASDNLYFPPRQIFGKDAEDVHAIGKVRAVINPL